MEGGAAASWARAGAPDAPRANDSTSTVATGPPNLLALAALGLDDVPNMTILLNDRSKTPGQVIDPEARVAPEVRAGGSNGVGVADSAE